MHKLDLQPPAVEHNYYSVRFANDEQTFITTSKDAQVADDASRADGICELPQTTAETIIVETQPKQKEDPHRRAGHIVETMKVDLNMAGAALGATSTTSGTESNSTTNNRPAK